MTEIEKATQQYQERSVQRFEDFKERIKSELGDELFEMVTFNGAIAEIEIYGIQIDWERPKRGKWNARQYWISPTNLKHSYPMSNYWDFCVCKWCDPNTDQLRQIVLEMIARVNAFCAEKHKSKQLEPYWHEKPFDVFPLMFIAFGLGGITMVLTMLK